SDLRPRHPHGTRERTRFSAGPRTGCTSRAVATRVWAVSRGRLRRSRRPTACSPSMWRKLFRIARRTSSRVSELALAVFASETGTHLIRPPRGERWPAFERRFDERAYLARLAAGGYRFLPRSSPDFPPLLRAVHDPPAGLFLRGVAKPELLARPAVAIVGARACSGYGSSVARSLGRELAHAGLVVVSGMARGVDGEAHRGALEAGGPTVAVLGRGIDRDYPAAHGERARRVA